MLQKLGSYFLVPAQNFSKKNRNELDIGRKKLIDYFGANEVYIRAKDGIELNGVLCQKPKAFWDFFWNLFSSRKIIIHFGGNGKSYESLDFDYTDIAKSKYIIKAYKLGYDVLLFNYRGVGKSKGSPTPIGLVEDGKAVLDYAIKDCVYDPKNVYVHGHSLGGAIASKAVSETKYNVHLINDRSFSSIKAVLNSYKINWLIKKILSFLLAITRWNIDVVEDWKKIKSKKIIIVDKNDEVIPLQGSLFHFVKDEIPKEQIYVSHGFGHCGNLFESQMKEILSKA